MAVIDTLQVNGVSYDFKDKKAYVKPATGIPASDIAEGVIPDVSPFITKSVDDLVNYYLKSETYTKAEVQALIGAINQFKYEVYASLEAITSPANNVLYLIGPTGSGSDKYEEYVWPDAQTGFVLIGTTSIDLSGYVTTTALNTALANYTTTANLTTLLAAKLDKTDVVNDLTTGGTAKALSAEQGKVLDEKVSQLGQEVNKTVLTSRNILDPNSLKNGYIHKDTGDFTSNSSYRCTDFIEIGQGVFALNWLTASNSSRRGVNVYDSNKTFLGFLTAPNASNGPVVLSPGNFAQYPTAKYARFNFGNKTAVPDSNEPFSIYRLGYLPTYEAYGTTTKAAFISPDVKLEECEFIENEYGKNRCGHVMALASSYLQASNGVVTYGALVGFAGITDFIEVQGNDLICNKASALTNYSWAAYDEDYVFTHGSTASGEEAGKYKYQAGDKYVRFELTSLTDVQVEIGSVSTEYTPFTVKQVIKKAVLPNIEGSLAEDKIFPNTFKILLPSKVYAVVGDTLQLFFKGIVDAVDPLVRWVKATSTKGEQFRRYWEYTPQSGETGEYDLNIAVYDDNLNALSSLGTTLKVVAAPTSPASTKRVLALGASTTSGGEWVCEAQRRLLASDGTPQGAGISNIAFVGKESKTLYGQTGHFEAHAGWSWKDYATEGRGGTSFRFFLSGSPNVTIGNVYTNNSHSYTVTEVNVINGVLTILCDTSASGNTPTQSGTLTLTSGSGDPTLTFTSYEQSSGNPFWDSTNNKLSFQPYVDAYCGGSIDIVYAMLGTNGLYSMTVAQQKAYIKTFVEALHAEYASCKVVLLASARPSLVNMLPGYGAGANYADVYKDVIKLTELYEMYKDLEDEYEFVEFESWCAQFDSDYNYPLTQKAVNIRNTSITEPYANNTVHPGEAGYMQYADAAYRSIVARFCQSS